MVSAMDQDYVIQDTEIQKLGKIAKGGFGVVYKGLMQGRIEVVIKELYNQNLTAKAKLEFENETALMCKMSHPNVITVYGYCQSPLSLVMEFMPRSLFHLLHSNQEIPWELRYNISLDIVQGLQHIHKKNIIHRDIKSLNILLDNNNKAKITDFGLSRIRTESKSILTKSEVGTVCWMAPEIMSSRPKYSVQSDIFALGVTFWEIAALKVPFEDAKPEFIKDDIKAGEREEIPEDCPQQYQQIIKDCWQQIPTERTNLQQIQTALMKLLKEFQTQSAQPNLQSLKLSSQQQNLAPKEENKTAIHVQKMFEISYDKSQDQIFTGHADSVYSIAISPDQKWIVSASKDKTIKVWDFQTGSCLRTFTGHAYSVNSIAISPDQKWIVSASDDDTIKVWDFQTGSCLRTFTGHTSLVNSIAISPDQKWIVSASRDDKTIKVWDFQTGSCLRTLTGHANEVLSVAIPLDQKYIVSASRDTTIKVWDFQTGSCLRTLTGHADYVRSVAISPDQKWIVSASLDKTIKVWDFQTGQLIRTLVGHSDNVYNALITSDNGFIISASNDQTIKIWNFATGECIQTLTGHSRFVFTLALSVDNKWILSSGGDKVLRKWRIAT